MAQLLVGHNFLQIGDLDPEAVQRDLSWFITKRVPGAFRSTLGVPGRAGRWFHGARRSYSAFAEELDRIGLEPDAAYYLGGSRR